jgi:glyoxylase I family protein
VKAPPLLQVHHVAVQVRDLERARAFYVDVLGLPLVRTQAHALWVQCGGTLVMLELCTALPATPAPFKAPDAGLHLLAFTMHAHDKDAWRAHLAACAVPVVHETAYTLYVRDTDGTRIGISCYPLHTL